MLDICPHCQQRMPWCRVCARHVCERAREMHQTLPGVAYWSCASPDWCTHGGYAKKDRFTLDYPGGSHQLVDDETEKRMPWDGNRREWTILEVFNQLAFELDMLKQKLVKDTE